MILKQQAWLDIMPIMEKHLFYTDATGNPWTATYIQAKVM